MTAVSHINRLAIQAARQASTALAKTLGEKNIRVSIRDVTAGSDLSLTNHTAADEFGTSRRSANPVVRSLIEKIRAGDIS
jgi:hypothetical protein